MADKRQWPMLVQDQGIEHFNNYKKEFESIFYLKKIKNKSLVKPGR